MGYQAARSVAAGTALASPHALRRLFPQEGPQALNRVFTSSTHVIYAHQPHVIRSTKTWLATLLSTSCDRGLLSPTPSFVSTPPPPCLHPWRETLIQCRQTNNQVPITIGSADLAPKSNRFSSQPRPSSRADVRATACPGTMVYLDLARTPHGAQPSYNR